MYVNKILRFTDGLLSDERPIPRTSETLEIFVVVQRVVIEYAFTFALGNCTIQ